MNRGNRSIFACRSGALFGTLLCVTVIFAEQSHAQYTLTTLATFDGVNGYRPYGDLISDADGNLFGTTVFGGYYGGNIFKVAAGTHAVTSVAICDNTTGGLPYAGLVMDAG